MPISLITGANGFAGSHLAEYLLKQGHTVRCLVRKTSDLSNLKGLEVEFHYGEITQLNTLPPALDGVDYVFHFAALTKARTPEEYFRVNADGVGNVARACLNEPGIKKLVYCSSLAAVGPQTDDNPVDESTPPHPISVYGRSKLAGEEQLRKMCGDNVPWAIVRPTGVYGSRDKDIFIYFKVISKGFKILVSGGDRKVSLIHVRDLAQLSFLAATKSEPGEIFMASDGNAYTWEELSDHIESALHVRARKIKIPMPLTAVLAEGMEILGRIQKKPMTLNREKIRELKARGWVVSIDKAKQSLGFKVEYPIEKGIKEAADWYREKGWIK